MESICKNLFLYLTYSFPYAILKKRGKAENSKIWASKDRNRTENQNFKKTEGNDKGKSRNQWSRYK